MEQTTVYSPTEIDKLDMALEKLFVLQDKAISSAKKKILIEELEKKQVIASIAIQAIKSLYEEDIKSIKLATILTAVQFITPTTKEQYIQGHCTLPSGATLAYRYCFNAQGRDLVCATITTDGDNMRGQDVFIPKKDVDFNQENARNIKKHAKNDAELNAILAYDLRFIGVDLARYNQS